MAKYLGTGKDPRAPEGVDFDIPDARPQEQEKIEESGVGERVPDAETHLVPHAGHEVIEAEGGVPGEVGAPSGPGVAEDRVAARVESTSAYDGEHSEGAAGAAEPQAPGQDEDLDSLSRDELNARAEAAGVQNAKSLPNKEAVAEAIRAQGSGAE